MTTNAITLEGIGKAYQIGVRAPGEEGLARAIKSTITAPVRNLRRLSGADVDARTFWALRDVSFEVPSGQVLGIVGRNGAGKSTLLKILSRITEPTEGRARVRGRIASLLEVGTGFHPELTGRENVYLNGAILGMSRAEIAAKYDQIVDFAGVEQFLETPVKRYSSGMFLRLAFAVAAFLEPEILVIDEVLAVGDAKFQKKCLGRMREVSRGDGRTVLFVSHNMATVQALCDRCVLLDKGTLKADGDPADIIEQYHDLASGRASTVYDLAHRDKAWEFGTGAALVTKVEIARAADGAASAFFANTGEIELRCTVTARENAGAFRIAVIVKRADGTPVGACFGPDACSLTAGETGTFRVSLNDFALAAGTYCCEFKVGTGNPNEGRTEFDAVDDVAHFEITPETAPDGSAGYWEPAWGPVKFQPSDTERIA
ncbi:MAG: hypothetical protein DHS20C14_13360 [Phycisphaeraceae bacterium]|nr:MAG: hypothetical protein DHS20C14_13360 [Phycisphaeraceae bacterium]